jgi:transcriptional regulator with XRE-family HTH domain
MEIYRRVHELRQERGLRHKDCADAVGLGTREAFRQRRKFTPGELALLAKLFEVPFAEAFPMVPGPKPPSVATKRFKPRKKTKV